MKFRDGVERDPEEYGYQVLFQKNLDAEIKKQRKNPNYRPSLELVRECTQLPKAYQYRIKLKDLAVGETFYSGQDE